MRSTIVTLIVTLVVGVVLLVGSNLRAGLIGPTPYLSFNDSPFKGLNLKNFQLEDFEDGQLNVPGVSTSPVGAVLFPIGDTDSVDADDGAIDGNGNGGHSFFGNAGVGFSFIFDKTTLGGLPTHAGIVWTDGLGTIFFEAFDQNGASLGTIGPFSEPGVVPDDNVAGGTAEDRFFGATNDSGISRIFISSSGPAGIELDHLQFGGVAGGGGAIPLPPAAWAAVLTLGGWRAWRRVASVAKP